MYDITQNKLNTQTTHNHIIKNWLTLFWNLIRWPKV